MKREDVKLVVIDVIQSLVADKSVVVSSETPLIGDGRILDSMNLVELCVNLEDKASEMGFAFDWTSEVALSKSRSMFRTAGTLAEAFCSQMEQIG